MIQNYTLTWKFMKKKILAILKNTNLQSQANYDDKESSKKNLHILEDVTSGKKVLGDIEQVIV